MIRTVLTTAVLAKSVFTQSFAKSALAFATVALTSTLLPSLAIATQPFDCSALGNDQQVETYAHDLPPLVLRGLAQTCENQAATFEQLAADAKEAIATEDTTKLHAKAATAFANVAMFTNLAIMK